jgi:hypothetical protein
MFYYAFGNTRFKMSTYKLKPKRQAVAHSTCYETIIKRHGVLERSLKVKEFAVSFLSPTSWALN